MWLALLYFPQRMYVMYVVYAYLFGWCVIAKQKVDVLLLDNSIVCAMFVEVWELCLPQTIVYEDTHA